MKASMEQSKGHPKAGPGTSKKPPKGNNSQLLVSILGNVHGRHLQPLRKGGPTTQVTGSH